MEFRLGEIIKVGVAAILVIALSKWILKQTPYSAVADKY